MRQKRRIGGFKKRLPKLFRARSIIVVCEHGVDHIPLSPRLQWLGAAALILLFCFISYSTGSYMAAESVIAEKDRKIVAASLERKRLGEEMFMLKRDLVKLNQTADDMSDYDKFVMQQYSSDKNNEETAKYNIPGALFASTNPHTASGNDMMQQRLAFLENQVAKLKEENVNIVMAVYDKTKDKISDYEEIIAMTGLLPDSLMKQAAAKVEKKSAEHAAATGDEKTDEKHLARLSEDDAATEATGDRKAATHGGQGGPFVELDSSFNPEKFSPTEWEQGLDHLLMMQKVMNVLPLALPENKYEITSTFGRRLDPFRGRFAMHTGIDFAGGDGSKVLATNDGVVSYAGYFSAYGNAVDIDHGLGITTRYGHMKRFFVRPGQKVKKGDVIGIQGSTGRSTGSHLHYEVRYYDRPLNPMKFIQAGKYVLSQNNQ